jgi:hypothetical protein
VAAQPGKDSPDRTTGTGQLWSSWTGQPRQVKLANYRMKGALSTLNNGNYYKKLKISTYKIFLQLRTFFFTWSSKNYNSYILNSIISIKF